jgi:hypothetical protein
LLHAGSDTWVSSRRKAIYFSPLVEFTIFWNEFHLKPSDLDPGYVNSVALFNRFKEFRSCG